jgi:phospholipid transport system transporter-binding protein
MINATFKPSSIMTFTTVSADRLRFIEYCRNWCALVVCIDLQYVSKCDSAGLALLIEAKRICAASGWSCQIVNMPQITQDLAKFYGVSELFVN